MTGVTAREEFRRLIYGGTTHAGRRGLAALIVVLLIYTIGSTAVRCWRIAIAPLVTAGAARGTIVVSDTPSFTIRFIVRNRGLTAAEVVGIGRDGPGLKLGGVAVSLPRSVPAGDTFEVMLTYLVTDCYGYLRTPWPVPVRVKRPWGVQTIHVTPPPMRNVPKQGEPAGWQVGYADTACFTYWPGTT